MNWIRWSGALFAVVALVACDRTQSVSPPSAPTATSANWQPTRALPKLETVKLWLGARELDAELCVTPEQVATGLMFRPDIKEDELMLFLFRQPDRASFWMKNVEFDIDVAYITAEGVISEVVHLKKHDEKGVQSKSDSIQFVLEARDGWFARNGFGPGTLIRTPKGSLKEVLGPRARVERP